MRGKSRVAGYEANCPVHLDTSRLTPILRTWAAWQAVRGVPMLRSPVRAPQVMANPFFGANTHMWQIPF